MDGVAYVVEGDGDRRHLHEFLLDVVRRETIRIEAISYRNLLQDLREEHVLRAN